MSVIYELALKRIFRQKLTVIIMSILPLILVFLPRRQGFDMTYLSFGLFGLIVLFTAFLLTKQVIEDRQYHTIIRIAASPITHRDYLLGHLSAYLTVMIFQSTMFWGLSFIIWGGDFRFFALAYALLIVFTITAICFSLFWHTMFKTYATSVAVFSIVVNLMALIGGMSFPLEYLPDRLRQFAIILPTYWYAYGLDASLSDNITPVIMSLLILLGFAIIFIVIGSKRRLA